MDDPYVVARWTGLKSVIDSVNSADDREVAVEALMMILLSKIDLRIPQMGDAVEGAFITFESLSMAERTNLSKLFDEHLASIQN